MNLIYSDIFIFKFLEYKILYYLFSIILILYYLIRINLNIYIT